MEKTLPHIPLDVVRDGSVAAQVAIPFAVFVIGELAHCPVEDFLVPVEPL